MSAIRELIAYDRMVGGTAELLDDAETELEAMQTKLAEERRLLEESRLALAEIAYKQYETFDNIEKAPEDLSWVIQYASEKFKEQTKAAAFLNEKKEGWR